jgi:carboxyl-terminal processing protease
MEEKQQEVRQSSRKSVRSVVGTTVIAVAIFFVGVVVGQGNISFGSHRSSVNPQLPNTLDYSSVDAVYKSLKENYAGKLTVNQLVDGLKEGLADAANDPYTQYFTAKEAQQFDNELNNTFSGIGAELGKDANDNLVVVAPIKGYPAARAGLKAKDIIASVNGKTTQGMSIDQAVTIIRGKKGTTVKLQIIRDSKQLDFTITRQDIKLPSVTSKVLDGNIGYIQISTFGDDTAELVNKAAAKFQQAHVKGVVLDLRGNPGGLLPAAVSVSSQWLPEDTLILQEKKGATVVDQFNSQGEHRLVGVPTVVLMNSGSASASEITAGALHDNKAAYIIGEKSFGKGVVQQLINFDDGSELKVTVASWYRPNGQNINKKGIKPDKKVVLTDADAQKGSDTQKNAALDYLKK